MAEGPSTILIYGESDAGKSAQLAQIAKWEYQRTGRITRAIIADSTYDPYRELVISPDNPTGIIQAANVKGLKDPWNRLELMAQGYWPEVRPGAGGAGFNLVMVPPKLNATGRIIVHQEGKDVEVGQVMIEGLTTISDLLLQDHADHADSRPMWGSGEKGVSMFETEAPVLGADGKTITLQKTKIGRAVGGHYGSVQKWMLEVLIPRFSQCRYLDRVVWTAHTGRGKDEFTGMEGKALGPATVGQASVDKTTKKFGHSFHIEVTTSFNAGGDVKREFKGWFISHPDSEFKTLNWPAKVSLSVERAKALLAKYPKGYIPLTDGSLTEFLEFLEAKAPKVTSTTKLEEVKA